MKKCIPAILVLSLWAILTAAAWLLPQKDLSVAERRPLAQMPEIEADAILDGEFMEDLRTTPWISSPCGTASGS